MATHWKMSLGKKKRQLSRFLILNKFSHIVHWTNVAMGQGMDQVKYVYRALTNESSYHIWS